MSDEFTFREVVREALSASRDVANSNHSVGLFIESLTEQGYRLVPDQPEHYVTFDKDGWFIEHSIICRLMGTIGTCEYNTAIREVYDEPVPDEFGRWKITLIDDEGLPSLERA